MKLYLIVILFFVFILIGLFVYYIYYLRVRLYKDLCYICNSLSNNISFKKQSINDIILSLYPQIHYYTRSVIENKNRFYKIISKEKFNFIIGFFESLGLGDVSFEVESIEYYENIFKSEYLTAKDDLNKKGAVYFKLLVGVGLILCIILF